MARVLHTFWVFLRLGLTSFGGPSAHLAFFREEFVTHRKWLSEERFSSLLAMCQFLPGPGSSQLGFAIGKVRAGIPGAFAAWLGFTTPSAVLMIALGLGMLRLAPEGDPGWLQGLRVAVVVVVANAVRGMAKGLCPTRQHVALALVATMAMLLVPHAWAQLAVIAVGGWLGWMLFVRSVEVLPAEDVPTPGGAEKAFSWGVLVVFAVLLVGGGWMSKQVTGTLGDEIQFAHGFYQGGSLVFGGGHVVLPLLRDFVVPPGWMTDETFMAGYGAAQAMPGPLFTIAAYLGTVSEGGPLFGVIGGVIALVAIFLPSWLLVFGVMPHWERLSGNRHARAALQGANAAVVGLLLAALYDPVWTSGMLSGTHVALGWGLFALTVVWKCPPWAIVLVSAGAGWLLF